MKKETKKPRVFCGVTDMDDNPVHMTEEEKNAFVKMCSCNGEYDVIFCEASPMKQPVDFINALTDLDEKT